MAKKEERAHALLSASSAKQWLACTPSAKLCEEIPDEGSLYAAEGTLAHSLSELKLAKLFTDQNMTTKAYNTRFNKIKKNELYQPEMDKFTDDYVDYVSRTAFSYPATPYITIEKRVDYSAYAPEGFGTADCIVISGNEMHVIDLKYGKGVPVTAEGNPQATLYALGALLAYQMIYQIEKIILHIVQPRLDNYSVWETTTKELLTWGDIIVKPKAELAFKGEGEYKQGEHCKFCRAASLCRQRAEDNTGFETHDIITGKEKLPPLLSDEEVGQILQRAQFIKDWVGKLEKYALNALVAGGRIPGWKLVEGRSNRVITDIDAAFEALQGAGYQEALLYDKKPITLTAVEKLVSKEEFTHFVGPYIEKPQGSPTLALETDKRPEYVLKSTAADDFGGTNTYKED